MARNNTGNPIGSDEFPDFQDNVKNLDVSVNSESPTWNDRFGKIRKTWSGIEQDFQQFLLDSGYVNIGDYAAGIEITARNQIFWRDGELYRASASLELPYITTGIWESESDFFIAVGDQSLRQDLSSPSGSGLIGFNETDVYEELSYYRKTLPISINRFGAVGDFDGNTGFNNSSAIKLAFESALDNQIIYIPNGRYLIDVQDSDLTDVGFGRDYAYLMIEGKSGIRLSGPGEIVFRCSSSSLRVWFAVFKDCIDCTISEFNISGELVKNISIPNSEIGVGYGFMFYDCEACGISDSIIKDIAVPWSFTGQPKSPATVTDVTRDCYVSNTLHDNFEQNSTFGSGASGLRINNNTFIDPYTGFKISQNPSGDSAAGSSGRILFSNNLIYWRPTTQIAPVFYDTTRSWNVAGVMVEASVTDVLISGNLIDMSSLYVSDLPPISASGPIVMFGVPNSGAGGILDPNRIVIQGGSLIAREGYSDRLAITSSATYRNLTIQGVHHVGGIRLQSGSIPTLSYGNLSIKGNVGRGVPGTAPGIIVGAGRYRDILIEGNTIEGSPGVVVSGDTELLFLSSFTCSRLVVKGNTLPGGSISTYGSTAFTCDRLDISGNTVRGVDVSTVGTLNVSLTGNDAHTLGTAYKIALNAATKASCKISVVGNSAQAPGGGVCPTALNLNGGLLTIIGNGFFATPSTAFTFDPSVNIHSGDYYGSGAPSQQAITGVRYTDLNVTQDGSYLKTTSSGSGGWKKFNMAI